MTFWQICWVCDKCPGKRSTPYLGGDTHAARGVNTEDDEGVVRPRAAAGRGTRGGLQHERHVILARNLLRYQIHRVRHPAELTLPYLHTTRDTYMV
jgi:hypothetical protein